MYVAVKGGEQAIDAAHRQLAEERRGDPDTPAVTLQQIAEQLGLAVDRVMTEGSLCDRELAALALKQARGDAVEAVFLLRAYRNTLPRFGATQALDTGAMRVRRRISAAFKDLPGGQLLGATFDYSHRLLDFSLADDRDAKPPAGSAGQVARTQAEVAPPTPHVLDLLGAEGLVEAAGGHGGREPQDITREPLAFPASRAARLQVLARADEGFLLSLAYSTQRGHGRNHPFAGEIRHGEVTVEYTPPELGFAIAIGDIELTECESINQFRGSATRPPQFTRGYGLGFGHCERRCLSMALVDRALRATELGEPADSPAQDQEFVLAHGDSVEASGFVQHLKLPHYVDFQSELQLLRRLRAAHPASQEPAPVAAADAPADSKP